MSAAELQSYYRDVANEAGDAGPHTTVEQLDERRMQLRVEIGERFARPGGTVSGPALFALADAAGWMFAVAHRGAGSDAFTTDISMQFLRPVSIGSVVVESTVLRRGTRQVFEVAIDPQPDGPAVHAVVAFTTRPRQVL